MVQISTIHDEPAPFDKAFATKSLPSYSLSSLLFNNLGSLLHALSVYRLPL